VPNSGHTGTTVVGTVGYLDGTMRYAFSSGQELLVARKTHQRLSKFSFVTPKRLLQQNPTEAVIRGEGPALTRSGWGKHLSRSPVALRTTDL